MLLNLDEPWVAYLFSTAGLQVVPSMLVADPEGIPEDIVAGASQIIMYLLLNVEI